MLIPARDDDHKAGAQDYAHDAPSSGGGGGGGGVVEDEGFDYAPDPFHLQNPGSALMPTPNYRRVPWWLAEHPVFRAHGSPGTARELARGHPETRPKSETLPWPERMIRLLDADDREALARPLVLSHPSGHTDHALHRLVTVRATAAGVKAGQHTNDLSVGLEEVLVEACDGRLPARLLLLHATLECVCACGLPKGLHRVSVKLVDGDRKMVVELAGAIPHRVSAGSGGDGVYRHNTAAAGMVIDADRPGGTHELVRATEEVLNDPIWRDAASFDPIALLHDLHNLPSDAVDVHAVEVRVPDSDTATKPPAEHGLLGWYVLNNIDRYRELNERKGLAMPSDATQLIRWEAQGGAKILVRRDTLRAMLAEDEKRFHARGAPLVVNQTRGLALHVTTQTVRNQPYKAPQGAPPKGAKDGAKPATIQGDVGFTATLTFAVPLSDRDRAATMR